MRKKITLFELTTVEAAELFKKTKTVLFPFGSIEQHGPHMPLGTDGIGAYLVAKRIAEKTEAIVAPLLPVGVSYYHMGWPGTLTVSNETYAKFVEEMTLSVVQHGAREIVYISGHGGQRQGLELAAINVQRATDARVLITFWFLIPNRMFKGEYDLGHAGRIETDFVLAYDPELVDVEKAVYPPDWKESVKKVFNFGGWGNLEIYPTLQDFKQVSEAGWYGDVKAATAEEGQMLIDKAADEIIEHMKRVFVRRE